MSQVLCKRLYVNINRDTELLSRSMTCNIKIRIVVRRLRCYSILLCLQTIQKMMNIGNGNTTGICGNVEQNMTVSWNVQKDTDNFTLHFVKNETTKHYSLHHFEISLAPEEFPADKWSTVSLHKQIRSLILFFSLLVSLIEFFALLQMRP